MTIESLDNISTYSIIIIAIYIAVAATIVPFTVMGENIRKTIQENPYFQHILTFSIIFFLIVLFNKIPSNVQLNGLYSIINSPNSELLKLFGISILIYALFIMSSRASLMFTSIILVLLLILFILNTIALKKKDEKNEEEYNKYVLSKNIIFIIIILLCTTGTVMYIIDKYKEYGDNFTILTFLFEDPKFNTTKSKSIVKKT